MTSAIDPRRAQLRRLKTLALGLLLLMLAGFAVSHWQGEHGIWAWVSAFCEAAAVGALADWFAVVALTRENDTLRAQLAALRKQLEAL